MAWNKARADYAPVSLEELATRFAPRPAERDRGGRRSYTPE